MADTLYKIMIVDDDKFLLGMYELKFRKGGHEVVTQTSAADTLAKLKEGYSPDILLLDIILPGTDGLQLLETIRREKLAPEAVVVMLTNQSGTEEIERAKTLDVAGYLVKATLVPSEVVAEVIKIARAKKGN